MASGRTVRQVKHGERLRRSQTSLSHLSSPESLLIKHGKRKKAATTAKSKSADEEVDGYGPYKPVPPPKPLPQQQQQQQQCVTPPPYRMPPYPLYNEPSIPGTTVPLATSSPATPQNLQTHSSKFPIEREVILSSTDKNSKIPILHDYMKKTKGAIAPDVPPKQMAAWTQGNHQKVIGPDQNHTGHVQTPENSVYRATYHAPHTDYYNSKNIVGVASGAVPRSSWHGDQGNKNLPVPPRQPQSDDYIQSMHTVQIETNTKEPQKTKTMTKTYHTIKDIISSKFKSNKDTEEKSEEGLNNVSEELSKSVRNIDKVHEEEEQKGPGTGMTLQQHQYNQHLIQQQMLVQRALENQQALQNQQAMQNQQVTMHHQQYQSSPYKNQQQQQQLMQARSQEVLSRPEEYYQQGIYQRPPNRYVPGRSTGQDPNYIAMQQASPTKELLRERSAEDRRAAAEIRSPQQLERDTLRQKSFEARRAASQPQLADLKPDIPDNRPQPQIISRRGSQGNLVETFEAEKDSDDGGFLPTRLGKPPAQLQENCDEIQIEDSASKDDSRLVNSGLLGTPRKMLEGEIGKIEGVYNVGQRVKGDGGSAVGGSANIGEVDSGVGVGPGNREQQVMGKKQQPCSTASSDYDKQGQSSSNADSGRGSAAYSSGRRPGDGGGGSGVGVDTSNESDHVQNVGQVYREKIVQGHDPEWVDIVESELRHILEPKLHELSLNGNIANSTLSESISSMTPPLPPLSPGEQSSPNMTPRNSTRYKHASLPYGSKPEYDNYSKGIKGHPGAMANRWHAANAQKHRTGKKSSEHSAILRSKQIFGLDNTDITSTTTRSMDLESMLDGQTDSDGDLSTNDARTIRKQLEGLEGMYSEVLKLLGVKKHSGRYQPSDPRFSKRRYGSMSSLPSSSVSSRPVRDKRRSHGGLGPAGHHSTATSHDDRKKVRDMRGINKRFQRLESHVVTLARSVAHLSSEMRTQHLMIQEMENIRGEIAALRTQTNMLNVRAQSGVTRRPGTTAAKELPSLANPTRVKKLTKFFGDEPPLLRLFLRKLGYEKYASVFENERIGMVELPYLTEERLQKMGVPLGPRLRIMEEAQISVCKDNLLCIV